MGIERRVFTAEFKRNAVELALGSDRPGAEIARELGIRPGALYRWLDEAREELNGSRKAFVGQGIPRDEELSRLRKENADLRETNEILKKATAIFAQGRLR